MCTEWRPTPILNHESEEGISVRDVALHDECPVEKGLVIQLLRLPCDELFGIFEGRRRWVGTRNCSLPLFRDSILRSHGGIGMEKT